MSRWQANITAVYLLFSMVTIATAQDPDSSRANSKDAKTPRNELSFKKDIQPFLKKYCADCHGASVQKAGFSLHEIRESDLEDWESIAENIELELMPPAKKIQPSKRDRRAVVGWIRSHLGTNNIDFQREPTSSFGNRVNHEDLFSGQHLGPSYSYSRMWRISQRIYDNVSYELRATRGVAGTTNGPIPALVTIEGEAFKDYDTLEVDDAAVRALMLNFRNLASTIVRGKFQKGRFNKQKNQFDPGTFDFNRAPLRRLELLNQSAPGKETYGPAVVAAFELLLSRKPNKEELNRYVQFLTKSIEMSDPATGCQNMVLAVLMSPEFVFRMELGQGQKLSDGRRMLGPKEIAYAIAYGLTDSPPDQALRSALKENRLSTKADVEREVRRMLAAVDSRRNWGYHTTGGGSFLDWKPEHNPRLLRFFQEFFGYTKGYLVFKDQSRNHHHFPQNLIRDADFMILDILKKDRAVLETLLTTDQFIVAYSSDIEGKMRRMKEWANERPEQYGGGALREGIQPVLVDKGYRREAVQAYGLRYWEWDYPLQQPFTVKNRVGFLSHPAWLVAWSGNFDNDAIRRGKWIREHLLADSIPELPIGVDAKLPNDPHQSLRDRMQVTRAEECWRCHKQMDPLGMAFEAYDDFGRFREGTIVLGDDTIVAGQRAKYSEQRSRLLKQIWKLTADSPEARAQQVKALRKRVGELVPPRKDHPRYEAILKEQSRHRSEWKAKIAELSKSKDDRERQAQLASLRRQLAGLKPVKPKHSTDVNASGVLKGTRDPQLDGPYRDVSDLMNRLAKSKRVRQSFIRHVFRYFMGRNEMISDSPTLMAMDKAYVESGGSFKEILVTLMTSDSFLTRRNKDLVK